MKSIKTVLSIIVFAIVSNMAVAQTKSAASSEFYLKGKWKVQCIPEEISSRSIQFSGLCATSLDTQVNVSSMHINNFEITFSNDSLTINQNGKTTTVAYKRTTNNYAFSFTFNKSKYSFRVFSLDKLTIIESKDGQLLGLTKID
jgi:hypothetical protein